MISEASSQAPVLIVIMRGLSGLMKRREEGLSQVPMTGESHILTWSHVDE